MGPFAQNHEMQNENPILLWPKGLVALASTYWLVPTLSFVYWTSTMDHGLVVNNISCKSSCSGHRFISILDMPNITEIQKTPFLKEEEVQNSWKYTEGSLLLLTSVSLVFWGDRHSASKILELMIMKWLVLGKQKKRCYINIHYWKF